MPASESDPTHHAAGPARDRSAAGGCWGVGRAEGERGDVAEGQQELYVGQGGLAEGDAVWTCCRVWVVPGNGALRGRRAVFRVLIPCRTI